MSNARSDAALKGFVGPFYPDNPMFRLLQAMYGNPRSKIDGLLLDDVARQSLGILDRGPPIQPTTEDGKEWYRALVFRVKGMRCALLFPLKTDTKYVDGTDTEYHIALYCANTALLPGAVEYLNYIHEKIVYHLDLLEHGLVPSEHPGVPMPAQPTERRGGCLWFIPAAILIPLILANGLVSLIRHGLPGGDVVGFSWRVAAFLVVLGILWFVLRKPRN